MDLLIAKADSIQPLIKRRKLKHKATSSKTYHSVASIASSSALPKSLNIVNSVPGNALSYNHITNPNLKSRLERETKNANNLKSLVKDAELLLTEDAGRMHVEGEMEKTWRITQDEITRAAGQQASRGRQEWVLDGGPYRSRYTRNGRHIAIIGSGGHVSTFDWQVGTIHSELQLQETCRDITFLHDQSHFAVAQKKYAFIYDKNGVELHCLKAHIEPTRLEYLPYHWLLASVGKAGYLKYQDTSTGQLLVEHRTKLGECNTMAQNKHNAVIHLGHQNGTVTLWTPNLSHPAVTLLAQMGPVMSISVDPSSGGRYMASAGRDGTVKVWDCRNWKGAIREWSSRGGSAEVEWSAKGALAVATGSSVNIYNAPAIHTHFQVKAPPPLYLTHPIPHRPLKSLRFCPYQDVLTIGHNAGLSSILVPGAGEPNFDSTEADPFENSKARREREVKALLDKIQPDMITLDPDFVGSLAPEPKLTTAGGVRLDIPFAKLPRLERLRVQGKADETDVVEAFASGESDDVEGAAAPNSKETQEKKRMRGKNKSMKRFMRRQRKNVIDPTAVAVRAKLDRQRDEKRRTKAIASGELEVPKFTALDRFQHKAE